MVDEVSGGRETSPRTRVLVVLAVLLLGLALAADRWRTGQERTALLEAVVSGEAVVERSSVRLRGLRAYVGPLVSDAEARPAARQWALDALRDEAARWRPRVRDERAEVLAVPVSPWHGDLAAARDAYAERLAAWDRLLSGVARRGGGSGELARGAAERAQVALVAAGTPVDRVGGLLVAGSAAGEAGTGPRR